MACPTPVSEAERQCGQRGVGGLPSALQSAEISLASVWRPNTGRGQGSRNDPVSLERAKHTLPHFEESL